QRLADIVARGPKAGTVAVVLGDTLCKLALALFDCSRLHKSPGKWLSLSSHAKRLWRQSKVIANWIWSVRRRAVKSCWVVFCASHQHPSPFRLTFRSGTTPPIHIAATMI